MATALQIILLLALIALIGIILGYIFGKIGCKRVDNSKYIDKSNICEDNYRDNVISNREEAAKEELQGDGAENSGENLAAAGAATVAAQSLVATKDEDTKEAESAKEDNAAKVDSAKADTVAEDTATSGATKAQGLVADTAQDSKDKASDDNTQDTKDSESAAEDTATTESSAKVEDDKKEASSEDTEATKAQGLVSETAETGASDNDAVEASSEEISDDYKPVGLLEARGGKADNLCRIKGVGTVIEGKLHALGIFHFDQIAAWTEKEIAWVDKHLAFSGRIGRENWIEQAKLLATGAETEFSKRVDKGEVETSRKS